MTINPLQATSAFAPSRDAVEKKITPATSGFEALLHSVTGAAGHEPVSPQVAADLLRIRMMQSTLALAVSDSGPAAASMQASQAGPGAFAYGPGLPTAYRGTAELETVEAEGEPVPGHLRSMNGAEAAGIEHIEETAARYLGTPYRFGGEGADGIDCSSFVQQVFHANQIDLPRTAREQINVGSDVPPGELRKGDLVFFQTYATYPSHVGIYLGDGKMIHASSGKGEVTISDMNSDYYRPRYLGAKRII
ncbi:C40 family peptidase [Geomonas subterranea]|uniref:C40 family peptidase n=1 Tax=Geomonas subterranea TaxID=2847989 RepID=A0ABX8LCT8_9BACT|nr:C40 family peptidase [Geomonas subterranea]QXE89141.1 C40 family peptidase [Geomonas subterranea]QXM08742.1 C40 family peptidase [Geomonas subterranea]